MVIKHNTVVSHYQCTAGNQSRAIAQATTKDLMNIQADK